MKSELCGLSMVLHIHLCGCLLSLCMILFAEVSTNPSDVPTICLHKCGSSMNGSEVYEFCKIHPELSTSGRCCINVTEEITLVVGIDLRDCGLNEQRFSAGIENISSLQYISLQGNNLQKVHNTDFHQNSKILYLSLPPHLPCPGRKGTWKSEKSTSNSTICLDEENACKAQNVTCPSNSHCVHTGVDMTECLCNEGFHGYKCLEQGIFPMKTFLIGILVPTITLSIFLYMTQRRHVIQQHSRKIR